MELTNCSQDYRRVDCGASFFWQSPSFTCFCLLLLLLLYLKVNHIIRGVLCWLSSLFCIFSWSPVDPKGTVPSIVHSVFVTPFEKHCLRAIPLCTIGAFVENNCQTQVMAITLTLILTMTLMLALAFTNQDTDGIQRMTLINNIRNCCHIFRII